MVSIFMLTYNQEHFIDQAIASVLNQKTAFKIQLVIGEDCSSDATLSICEKYAMAHPNIVKLLPSVGSNIGLIRNYMRTIKECDGTYIAICDGDDYWIDSLKLQKQVDFLENNKEYAIVYTAVRRLYENNSTAEYVYSPQKEKLDFDVLIFDNFIHSVTVLFRNQQTEVSSLPAWIADFPFGDWQTYLWTIREEGKIYFLNEVTAVYRMDVGITAKFKNSNSAFVKILVAILEAMYCDTNFKNRKLIIGQSLLSKRRDLIGSLNREKNYIEAFKFFISAIWFSPKKWQLVQFYIYSILQAHKNNKITT